MRRFICSVVPLLLLFCSSYAWAQTAAGASGPAAAELNRTFFFGTKWAMYGAPQERHLDLEDFALLVGRIRETRFAASHVQIVVIMRGSDAAGTIGLIEKRGKRVNSFYAKKTGPTVYDLWHMIGYNTTPEKIAGDFRENILAAEEAYKDLPLTFNASVRRVDKDASGDVFVEFNIKYKEQSLVCYPWQQIPQAVNLKELKAGHRLKVSGQFTENIDGLLKVRGCLFSRL